MNEYLAATVTAGTARGSLARSALPTAPVVPDADTARPSRRQAAVALRRFARTSDRLANRLDPVCC